MAPKLIKTPGDYADARRRMDALMSRSEELSPAEGDELQHWAILIEAYEKERFPLLVPTARAAIRFRMEQQGLKPKDLIPFIGPRNRVWEVLNGKRPLSQRMIRNLHKGLGIPLVYLLEVER